MTLLSWRQVTGEGVAEHLVEMRTILDEQKQRLEMKIRSLQDDSRDDIDADSASGDQSQGEEQQQQPQNNGVVDNSRQPTPGHPESALLEDRGGCDATDRAEEGVSVNPVAASAAGSAAAVTASAPHAAAPTTGANAAAVTALATPGQFDQSAEGVAMDCNPHVSAVQGNVAAAAAASASLRYLGPPPAVAGPTVVSSAEQSPSLAPLGGASAPAQGGAPFHMGTPFHHAIQAVTPLLPAEGDHQMRLVQHQGATNGVWLGQTTAHGALLSPNNTVCANNQNFLFQGHEWAAAAAAAAAAPTPLPPTPHGGAVPPPPAEFAPPAGFMPPVSSLPLSSFPSSIPLAPLGWPQAMLSGGAPPAEMMGVAGAKESGYALGGGREGHSRVLDIAKRGEAGKLTEAEAAAMAAGWRYYHDSVKTQQSVQLVSVGGRSGHHDHIEGGRNGTREDAAVGGDGGACAAEDEDSEEEGSGGAARCSPMLGRSVGLGGARAARSGKSGRGLENLKLKARSRGDSLGGEINGINGPARGVSGGVEKSLERATPTVPSLVDRQTSSSGPPVGFAAPAAATQGVRRVEQQLGDTRGSQPGGSDSYAPGVRRGDAGDAPVARMGNPAVVTSVAINGGRGSDQGDAAASRELEEQAPTLAPVVDDQRRKMAAQAMLSFR